MGGVCTPGAQIPCYSGPMGTEGVGICKAGVQTCNPNGLSYGPCVGEVQPKPENCDTPEDENCDGSPGPCGGIAQWSKSFGSTGDEQLYGLALDSQGRFAITGSFHGNIDFGSGPLSAGPTQGIFVAVYDSTGQHLWSKAWAGGTGAYGKGVGFKPNGDLVLAAGCDADIDFGGGPLFGPQNAICLAELDATGAHVWSKRFDGGAPLSLAVDPAGNILLGGDMNGDLGGGAMMGYFVAKLDPTAHFLWARQQVGYIEHLTTNASGDMFVHAQGATDIAFGGPQNLGSGSAVVKLSGATGAFSYGLVATSSNMQPMGIAVDPLGNAFATGYFTYNADFAGTTITANNQNMGYLAKLDPTGKVAFAKAFASMTSYAQPRAVAAGPSGEVVLAGTVIGSYDFGNGPINGTGLFVTKLDPSGAELWAHAFPNMDYYGQLRPFVAVDAQGGIIVAGSFSDTIDLGKGVHATSGMWDYDIFIARLSP
jgi:hypothetical protein